MSKIDNFPYPLLFWLKFGGEPFGVDPWCWGQPRLDSQVHKIVIREITFEEFQRMWSQSTNVTEYTRTDGQTTYHDNTALRYASPGKSRPIFSKKYGQEFGVLFFDSRCMCARNANNRTWHEVTMILIFSSRKWSVCSAHITSLAVRAARRSLVSSLSWRIYVT